MKKRLLEIYEEEEELVGGEDEMEKGNNETNYDMHMKGVDSEDDENKNSNEDDEDIAEVDDHDDEEDFDEEE